MKNKAINLALYTMFIVFGAYMIYFRLQNPSFSETQLLMAFWKEMLIMFAVILGLFWLRNNERRD